MTTKNPKGIVCPYPGAKYMHMAIIFKHTAWPIKAKFQVEPPWEGGKKFYINGSGHMTKMIAMPIYGKNFKKSSTDLIVLC